MADGFPNKDLKIFLIYNYKMLFLDSIILLVILGAIHLSRIINPNMFFFCRGAKLFLPPEWDQKVKKQQVEIKVIEIQYVHVKDFEMASQYERILHILISLILYLPIKYVLCMLFSHWGFNLSSTSTFCFMICLVAGTYALFIAIKILYISSYRFSYCLLVCVSINILFYFIRLTSSQLSSSYTSLNNQVIDYEKQLSIAVGQNIESLGENAIAFVILFINTLMLLAMIPSVIKFGNWYTTTMKEIYYDESDKKDKDQEKIKNQQQLKNKSKITIRYLNIYLFSCLGFIFFSHPYFQQFMEPAYLWGIRVCLFSMNVFIICRTLSAAIEFNGSYAYQFICQFFATKQKQVKEKMIRKIIPYIRQIWYHKFQYMFRIIFPLFLFIMLVDWKYLHEDNYLLSNATLTQTHCPLIKDELHLLQNLYKCSVSGENNHQDIQYGINGGIMSKDEEIVLSQEMMSKYGLLSNNLMVVMLEELLWYNSIGMFGMTIVYVLFLRKAVYEI